MRLTRQGSGLGQHGAREAHRSVTAPQPSLAGERFGVGAGFNTSSCSPARGRRSETPPEMADKGRKASGRRLLGSQGASAPPPWVNPAQSSRSLPRSGTHAPADPRSGARGHGGASQGQGFTLPRQPQHALPRTRFMWDAGDRAQHFLWRLLPSEELQLPLLSLCPPAWPGSRCPRSPPPGFSSPRIRDARGTTRHAHAGLLRGQDGVSCIWVNHPPARLEAHTSRLKAALRRELRA